MNYLLKPCKLLKTKSSVFIFTLLTCVLLVACSKKDSNEGKVIVQSPNNPEYVISNDKSQIEKYYTKDNLKAWYPRKMSPPPLDYNVDLSKKTISELCLLRNAIFARNGYLFDDAVLRGYFNQFKWYQPVFDVADFKLILSNQEHEFINKVIAREKELLKDKYVTQGSYSMIDMDRVHNLVQFEQIDDSLMKMLTEKNFAIVPASHKQFFHVYDNNHYQYIPNFITTDIYLQALHKHFGTVLRKTEEDKLMPQLTDLLSKTYEQSKQLEKETKRNKKLKKLNIPTQWTTTYLAVAYSLISGKKVSVPVKMDRFYKEELAKISKAASVGSIFLSSKLIQYSQFNPTGNYTKSKKLENYFKCMTWLRTAPLSTKTDDGLMATVIMASAIKRSPKLLSSFEKFNAALTFIGGDEDKLSLASVINNISDKDVKNIAALTSAARLNSLRADLKKINANKIKSKSTKEATKVLNENKIFFTAARYTFDTEILNRLVYVSKGEAKRSFPKGLDVFAAFGNKEAESILLTEYNEPKTWSSYTDSLQALKTQFAAGADWDKSLYSKTFETINTLNNHDNAYPLFMKTSYWDRKNLNTSLAAWCELKHDMLLPNEQPGVTNKGLAGGPPAPQHLSYVEPNVEFWKKALALIELQESTLKKMKLLTKDVTKINAELKAIGNFLLRISEKELANKEISNEEFNKLSGIGSRIEYLTSKTLRSSPLPKKEQLVALVADVYDDNGTYLEEAVGMVDEIYVVVEINNKPYLTKGAVFSYYEFNNNTALTDEDWGKQVSEGKGPERPGWINGITVKATSLVSKSGYGF